MYQNTQMGVIGFSKTFEPRLIKPKDLKNLTIAIDASVLIYKAALGAASIKTLTDVDDNPTLHISVILAKALNFEKVRAGQVWVFDFHEKGYESPDKELELAKRKKKRADANKKLTALKTKKEKIADELFSSDEDDDKIDKEICDMEKQCFSMSDQLINDCKFILDCLDITWCTTPKGYEAEHLCATLTNEDDLDVGCDAVFSTDADAVLYGAQQLIREVKVKSKKILQLYELDKILDDAEINIDDLIKIGVILGTDHAPKTSGVGPKTVLKKYKDVELTENQNKAVAVFQKTINIETIKFSNDFGSVEICQDKNKINKLIDWLVNTKNFNRDRVKKQVMKVYEGEL